MSSSSLSASLFGANLPDEDENVKPGKAEVDVKPDVKPKVKRESRSAKKPKVVIQAIEDTTVKDPSK